ncbi:MAG: hypothetical protein WEB63_00210 [Cucumibacter sp.]
MMRWLAGVAGLALLAAPAMAQTQDDRAKIVAACETEMTMPAGTCDCIADLGLEQLEPKLYSMLATMLTDPQGAASLAASGQLTPVEAMTVGMFLVTAPQQCALPQ